MYPSILPFYDKLDILPERGEGCYLYTQDGKRYIDFAVGYSTCAFGHANPRLVKALSEQASKLWLISNAIRNPLQEEVAELVKKISFAETMFFTNSGVEAWECGVKLVRHHFWAKGQQQRNRIIVCEGAFHGRTIAAVSAVRTPKMVDGFAPLLDGFDIVPFNDIAALEKAITPETAAIHFEPVQGESGIKPASIEYLQAARRLCDQHGLLLYFDEIQCGMGRTGKLWAYEHAGIVPDVMSVAKAFGGGFPVGACLTTAKVAEGIKSGKHGSTYAGNPLAMAVVKEVMQMVQEPHLLPHVNEVGAHLRTGLEKLQAEFPKLITEVRGKGLMLGLALTEPYAGLRDAALKHGMVALGAGTQVLRMVPPLIVTKAEIDEGLDILRKACQERAHAIV